MTSKDELAFLDSGQDDEVLFDKNDSQTHTFTNFPHSAVDVDDDEELAEGDKSQLLKDEKKSSPSFWTFEYYQQFFDVDSQQVLRRIAGSMTPVPNRNYLETNIRPTPDLYGPFWICTTLVFTTAIAGNLANYLASGGRDYKWKYDFHKVTFAATAIFTYWWLLPTVLYGLLWWRKSSAGYTFMEILCVYGYSLAIYIPISILWVINITWLQWLLVIVGAVLSGGVLLFTFWPAVKDDAKNVAIVVMGLIFLFHLLLAAGFVMYFFHVPASTAPNPVLPNTTVIPEVVHQEDASLKDQKLKAPAQALIKDTKPPPLGNPSEKIETNKKVPPANDKALDDNKVTPAIDKPSDDKNVAPTIDKADNKAVPAIDSGAKKPIDSQNVDANNNNDKPAEKVDKQPSNVVKKKKV